MNMNGAGGFCNLRELVDGHDTRLAGFIHLMLWRRTKLHTNTDLVSRRSPKVIKLRSILVENWCAELLMFCNPSLLCCLLLLSVQVNDVAGQE